MDSMIIRQAAIDAVSDGIIGEEESLVECVEECNAMIEWAVETLKKLPSAQSEQRWISCSERLPKSNADDLEYPTVLCCGEDGEIYCGCYYESTKEWGSGDYFDRLRYPIAWMPLPEPYRAERRTDEQTISE